MVIIIIIIRVPLFLMFGFDQFQKSKLDSRFSHSPLRIRVPLFRIFGFDQETTKRKGRQKGTTEEPSPTL